MKCQLSRLVFMYTGIRFETKLQDYVFCYTVAIARKNDPLNPRDWLGHVYYKHINGEVERVELTNNIKIRMDKRLLYDRVKDIQLVRTPMPPVRCAILDNKVTKYI